LIDSCIRLAVSAFTQLKRFCGSGAQAGAPAQHWASAGSEQVDDGENHFVGRRDVDRLGDSAHPQIASRFSGCRDQDEPLGVVALVQRIVKELSGQLRLPIELGPKVLG
jgi:hypothetical protein